ncbi:hypothetical protein V6R21_28700 [Limibacter armeniacum]
MIVLTKKLAISEIIELKNLKRNAEFLTFLLKIDKNYDNLGVDLTTGAL